ncbi:alpha/beta hydrolase [Thalassotalea marina]|uniref:AB hydrolase-1 domain-containing protein n=1 Tax=Thalassotalea marina TaxID=1673741 RepID=A0A919BKF3_9GAMM|nr:alpha/beta fold hydrolase [Thalassotalea marina]GHF96082.1 hypothetical protein GCM10017161_25530 [Thalassotalea marina]
MKNLLLFVVLFVSTSVQAESISPTKSGLYDVGGFKLYLACYQNNKPTLILEQGFGRWGSDGIWQKNIEKLQNHYSVCLYDRAGLGKSEKGPEPFTVNDTANWLHTLLQKAEINPPFYFAGGSYALYIIKAYNNLYPDNVLGAMFIDPPQFGYFYTMATRWPKNFTTKDKTLQRQFDFEQSIHDPMFERAPEKVDHLASYQLLKKARSFGSKPIITVRKKLTTERYDPENVPLAIATKMNKFDANAENYFYSLSTQSKVIYSMSDKHHLHITDPDLVVSSIIELQKSNH